MKRKFWNWIQNQDEGELESRTLFLNGEISDETWYGDEVTPKLFKDELGAGNGPITVWINSPGGDLYLINGNMTKLADAGIFAAGASESATVPEETQSRDKPPEQRKRGYS